jgi:hypothetical protein
VAPRKTGQRATRIATDNGEYQGPLVNAARQGRSYFTKGPFGITSVWPTIRKQSRAQIRKTSLGQLQSESSASAV